jgi:hypothetical protein
VARYGLTFRCDPVAAVLDRPAEDLPILMAVLQAAQRDLAEANKSKG